ncbi:uncharacterized protein [Dysidea avara]|uniref:uncharacterized protein isoform X3 n=1 Tax=Dysidea avara TaxID=196820 RepID=UPI00331665EC
MELSGVYAKLRGPAWLIVLICLLSTKLSASQVLYPGGNVTFTCNITIGRVWLVNDTATRKSSGELPDGLMADGEMLIVTESANDTLYGCGVVIDPNPIIDTGIVYLADVPNMVPGVMLDMSSISATPQFPAQPTQFDFTLNWGVPFANFDPILNYTIITSCSDNTVCPVTHVTCSDVTTLDISYTLPIITVNYTISITANNTVGSSDPVMRILAAPNQVQNVSVMCAPVDLDNECTVTWNDLAYGPNAVPLPILYLVSYSGINITAGSDTVMSSPHVFTLLAVDGSVIVSVTAYNDFGSGGTSLGVQDTIISPVVEATTSTVLEGDTPAETYSVEIECDISPSSTADYCEVIARNDDSTVSASAIIMNHMATVTVTGLVCEETYSIIAGGIITNDVMIDRTLDGPRFHTETILASACPVVITTTTAAPTVRMAVTPTITPATGGSSDDNTGIIIGVIVGGICGAIVVVVVIIIVIYCCCCRKDNKKSYSVAMHTVPPTYENVQPPSSDKVQMDTNPAYTVSTVGTIKMEDNPAYQTMTTNPVGGGGGAGSGVNCYEDINVDRKVKMTQNPAYAVP